MRWWPGAIIDVLSIAINDRDEEATWQHGGRPIACAIVTVDLHLNQMDTWLESGFTDRIKSTPLIARVITVEIKTHGNASGASDRDPTAAVSMRFITRINVASSRASDRIIIIVGNGLFHQSPWLIRSDSYAQKPYKLRCSSDL